MIKRLGRPPIKYKTGDLLGSNNHIFIKDLDDKVYEINGIKREPLSEDIIDEDLDE